MKLLNINKTIQDEGCLEVTSQFTFDKTGEILPEGLYSKKIFGTTSNEKSEKMGYIKLNSTVMHPAVYKMISKVDTSFTKCLDKIFTYSVVGGMLIRDENGSNGVSWLYDNWNSIEFPKYLNDKNSKIIEYVQDKSKIFIDKFLVVPIKFRPSTEKNGHPIEDELTMLYRKLLGKSQAGQTDNKFMQDIMQKSSKNNLVQQNVLEIYQYFLNKLQKKEGFFRSSLISKRIDNNARLVANARPDIPVDTSILPWHIILNIFDLYVIGALREKEFFMKDYLKLLKLENLNPTSLGEHFTYIYQNADAYHQAFPERRAIWVELLEELLSYHKDLRVLVSRDPAWSNKAYICSKILIEPTNSYHIVVSNEIYPNFGGDSFNSDIVLATQQTNIVYENKDYKIVLPFQHKELTIQTTFDNIAKGVFND